MVNMSKSSHIQSLFFTTAVEWEKWLASHHDTLDVVWLKFAKKNTGIPSMTYEEALLVALCYGWVDGQERSLNEKFYAMRFTPRRAKSNWSKSNIGRVEALTKAGRMKPAGLAQVEAAKKDGRWQA